MTEAVPTTFARIAAVVAPLFDREPGELTPETHVYDSLDADSLDVIELVQALEEEFGIEISTNDEHEIITLASAVALVERLRSPQGGP